MEAMVFRPFYSPGYPTSIKLKHGDRAQVREAVEKVYHQFFPDDGFVFSYLEDSYMRQYDDDNRFGRVVSIFTGLAIIISCLGLIGLSSYTAVQRTKEIGIRKVLGASLFNIVSILSIDFIRLVLVATLLSLPIAYFAMQSWLQGYAYRIPLTAALFVVPVVVIVVIAVVTISFQILKTAMSNPAETLKYE
jgi:putative ABC transport system permease protein